MRRKKSDPKYLSTETIAGELDMHPDSIRRWIDSGKLKAIRIGRYFRVSREDWEEFKIRNFKGVS